MPKKTKRINKSTKNLGTKPPKTEKYNRFKILNKKTVRIDFTNYWKIDPELPKAKINLPKYKQGQTTLPQRITGRKRVYERFEDLESAIDAYFCSCFGPLFNRLHNPIIDADGEPVIGKIRPYTRSGLMLHLTMSNTTFYSTIYDSKTGKIPRQWGELLETALQRIDAQAEEYLYDKDAGRGAQFYLSTKGRWSTPRDESEIKKIHAKIELEREEFALKKQLILDSDGDNEITINVVRKSKVDE